MFYYFFIFSKTPGAGVLGCINTGPATHRLHKLQPQHHIHIKPNDKSHPQPLSPAAMRRHLLPLLPPTSPITWSHHHSLLTSLPRTGNSSVAFESWRRGGSWSSSTEGLRHLVLGFWFVGVALRWWRRRLVQ